MDRSFGGDLYGLRIHCARKWMIPALLCRYLYRSERSLFWNSCSRPFWNSFTQSRKRFCDSNMNVPSMFSKNKMDAAFSWLSGNLSLFKKRPIPFVRQRHFVSTWYYRDLYVKNYFHHCKKSSMWQKYGTWCICICVSNYFGSDLAELCFRNEYWSWFTAFSFAWKINSRLSWEVQLPEELASSRGCGKQCRIGTL